MYLMKDRFRVILRTKYLLNRKGVQAYGGKLLCDNPYLLCE